MSLFEKFCMFEVVTLVCLIYSFIEVLWSMFSLLQILHLDIALVSVSLPDKHGFCSLGTSVDCTRSAIQNAKYIIGKAAQRYLIKNKAIMLKMNKKFMISFFNFWYDGLLVITTLTISVICLTLISQQLSWVQFWNMSIWNHKQFLLIYCKLSFPSTSK